MVSLVLSFLFLSDAKEIALTFDDCPMWDGKYYTGVERTKVLVKNLRRLNIHGVAFFCNTHNLDKDGRGRLKEYSREGHTIANHTATHPDLHKTTVADYIDNFETAHELLKGFATFRKWFRFPFLREGETLEKRDALRKYLAKREYFNGYVTVDTYDWYMNSLFQKALEQKKSIDFKKLEETYVKVLFEGVSFYDAIAQRVLKRSPRHVLLLHENDLAALYIDSLVRELRAQGWKIVSAKRAYQDPIAKECPDTLFLGQGRVVALAKVAGDKGPFWKWEDEKELDKLFEREKIFR